MRGEASVSSGMAARLSRSSRAWRGSPSRRRHRVTPREREVLDQVAKGSSNKQIALVLAITENTVKNHLKNMLEKLHLENRVQAATFALREDLTGLR